ncbi:MAG: hypothetical protein IKW74_01515, partial [Thermoguttaceae bacterium]|nr:hypothetical protein [Thermoguttaceae bacterium]
MQFRCSAVLLSCCFATFLAIISGKTQAENSTNIEQSNTPNRFTGTDSEKIAQAIKAAKDYGGVIRIPARLPDAESDRNFWLLDEAILLPADTTLYLDNCTVKLSDNCRDNIIRSANAGPGIEKVQPLKNIHIIGSGHVELLGADHPRSTGDAAKTLGIRSFGTDAGKEDESQTGDWRNIGILIAAVEGFTLQNVTLRQTHCWGVSFEKCSFGAIRNLTFDSSENRIIDGNHVQTLNQDGLDLRKGCHDIVIENIHGISGDDLVALTAIRANATPGGSFESTEVAETDPNVCNDIYNISIRNVVGYAAGGHQIIRLLNASGIKIHHIIIDGVIDTSPEGVTDRATIRIGDSNPAWGGVTPLGDTYGIIINNVQSKSHHAVLIAGSLCDSIITNVINFNPSISGVSFESGEENVRNVRIDPFT